ncbi:MAG: hypothetical protein KGM96_09005 [Acidobacteriota bacterium]|nr:hypothetical protein [Acidobacteriota bacterium]
MNRGKSRTFRFESHQWVPFPVEQVFAFFADPRNLPGLMPPELQTRIDEARLQPAPAPPEAMRPGGSSGVDASGVGSEILISFRPLPWLPLRVRWRARIIEFDWGSHFKDEQVQGPFAVFRHRHGTLAEMRNG